MPRFLLLPGQTVSRQKAASHKLGEYLATGRPVIVTDTGEISKYLKDKVNARIVKAGDESDFTEKLMWMLENPEESCKIGIKGRETAINNFDMNKIKI